MVVSTFFLAAAGTIVTERLIVPRLGEYTGEEKADRIDELSGAERRGPRFAGVASLLLAGWVLWGTVPARGFLRDPGTGDLLHSPFLSGIVALIFLGGLVVGVAYGIGARTFRSDADVMKSMGKSMPALGLYLVLVSFAAQFVAFFNRTNLGLILAVKGAVMAPVFIPIFMLPGSSPELTQAAYRVGDSTTNIVPPMMPYFALIVAFVERYSPRAGIGTAISLMLPYTVTFLAVWMALLGVWLAFGIPTGPGAPLYL
jgi:aminobenzoyl-glutamate transport protein